MKKLLIALGLTAALTTPAHAYYFRDCLRGAPCPGFYAPSPRYYAPAKRCVSLGPVRGGAPHFSGRRGLLPIEPRALDRRPTEARAGGSRDVESALCPRRPL
jgi:hypothetical protein